MVVHPNFQFSPAADRFKAINFLSGVQIEQRYWTNLSLFRFDVAVLKLESPVSRNFQSKMWKNIILDITRWLTRLTLLRYVCHKLEETQRCHNALQWDSRTLYSPSEPLSPHQSQSPPPSSWSSSPAGDGCVRSRMGRDHPGRPARPARLPHSQGAEEANCVAGEIRFSNCPWSLSQGLQLNLVEDLKCWGGFWSSDFSLGLYCHGLFSWKMMKDMANIGFFSHKSSLRDPRENASKLLFGRSFEEYFIITITSRLWMFLW